MLSLGCGDDGYVVSGAQIAKGGLYHFRKIIEGAMRLQSLAARNQARLLLGPPSVLRIDAPTFEPKLRMDDWMRASELLPPAAEQAIKENGEKIAELFLAERALPYVPVALSSS